MKPTYDHPQDVLHFCLEHTDAKLIVVTHVTGGTLRSKGALMAVTPHKVAGYISNGCVDADIILRARAGQSGRFIYGEGSPFRDIILPCGGRIEVVIFQTIEPVDVKSALEKLKQREEGVLVLEDMQIPIKPRLRLRIAGRGAAFLALADLAKSSGFDVVLQSPDPNIHPDVQHLRSFEEAPALEDDVLTAVALFFHDHQWEPTLLAQALHGDAFYVGAMGSQKTHMARISTLLEMGVASKDIDKISAPIGIIPTQRNARFLALSVLAEILQSAQSASLL